MKIVVDSSDGLTVGLLSNEFTWSSLESFADVKASKVLHSVILEMLKENTIDIKDIDSVIYCAGPGSYTGMRLAKGFADVLAMEGIPKESFFHYEIPKHLGVTDYLWITNAFKGEYFIYDSKTETNRLIPVEEAKDFFNAENIFTNSSKLMDEYEINSTKEMILQNPEFFKKITDEKKLYYFRLETDEFKVSNK